MEVVHNLDFSYEDENIGQTYSNFIDTLRAQLLVGGDTREFQFDEGVPHVLGILPGANFNPLPASFSLSTEGEGITVFMKRHNLYTLGFRCNQGVVYEMFQDCVGILPNAVVPGGPGASLLPNGSYDTMTGMFWRQCNGLRGRVEAAIKSLANPRRKSAATLGPSMCLIVQFIIDAVRSRALQAQYTELLMGDDEDAFEPRYTVQPVEQKWSRLSDLAIRHHARTQGRDGPLWSESMTLDIRNGRTVQLYTVRDVVEALGVALAA